MIFTTATGSTYELDRANKRVRRLEGGFSHSRHFRELEKWADYVWVSEVVCGEAVLFGWTDSPNGTLTSVVQTITGEEPCDDEPRVVVGVTEVEHGELRSSS